jgi:S-formylglutathione hydrolase FrmB
VTQVRGYGPLGLAACFACAFLAVGLLGARRYFDNFWVYRGFAPPRDPAFVGTPGTLQRIEVPSPALGGRTQEAYVYLPQGYSSSSPRRYPVLYLLHGFPGRPLAFVETVQMGVVDDVFTAKRHEPVILVMPFGSTGTFTDEEWVNAVGAGNHWGTFVSRDLVRYVDEHYDTIASPRGRAIGGLSEGGYGAINIALHHPREFSVVES